MDDFAAPERRLGIFSEVFRICREFAAAGAVSLGEELAGFSLLICCRIASLGGTQYPIPSIYGAVKRSGIKFKSWKRAVEIVSCAEFPPELVQCMREMLVNDVQRFFDEEKDAGHEPSEGTRSVLKKFKFFGKK